MTPAYTATGLRAKKLQKVLLLPAQTFELVINLKAARALGLTPAPSLLLHADPVIE